MKAKRSLETPSLQTVSVGPVKIREVKVQCGSESKPESRVENAVKQVVAKPYKEHLVHRIKL